MFLKDRQSVVKPSQNQSPASRRQFAAHLLPIGNQSPASTLLVADCFFSPICMDNSRPPVANRSLTGRRLVADWSATKSEFFLSHGGCTGAAFFGRKVVADRLSGCSARVNSWDRLGHFFNNGVLFNNVADGLAPI